MPVTDFSETKSRSVLTAYQLLHFSQMPVSLKRKQQHTRKSMLSENRWAENMLIDNTITVLTFEKVYNMYW